MEQLGIRGEEILDEMWEHGEESKVHEEDKELEWNKSLKVKIKDSYVEFYKNILR